jgi:sigma-E factor negative regulatory protein RseC
MFWGKKRIKIKKMFAHACVYEKLFVSLQSHFMLMDELIRHTGIVSGINGELAHVQIVQSSACSSCKAKSMCMSTESQQKEMDAVMLEPMQVGDRVEVEVREHLAWKAVLLAYVLPFIVMMSVIAVLDVLTGWDEAIVGTIALCSIALYYLVLSQFKHRLQKQFTFTVRKA